MIPVFSKTNSDDVIGVLDVDSDSLNSFDEIDDIYLKKICDFIQA